MTPEESSVLQQLDEILRSQKLRAQIEPIVERVRADLARKSDAAMAWEPIPLQSIGDGLPTGIRSAWVFILRAGANTGAERHPNSHQRMMTFAGVGDMQTGEPGKWKSNRLTSNEELPLEQRWISIPPCTWHQPVVPNESDWVVVSFHTVPAAELIEERPDAAPGATKQMRYLDHA